jgi:hypothetical protein
VSKVGNIPVADTVSDAAPMLPFSASRRVRSRWSLDDVFIASSFNASARTLKRKRDAVG